MKNASDEQNAVIARNQATVYRLALSQMKNRHDADDVFQEVFYRYLRKKPVFASAEHEKHWFIRVTLNCARSTLSSFWFRRTEGLPEELPGDFDEQKVDPEALQQALGQLDKRYRAVLHLYYYEDMSAKEIAAALALTENNVRMLLTRARRKLKETLEKENAI